MLERVKNEPVMVLAVVQAGVALVAAFGLNLSADQVATIVAFVAAVLSLVARSQVTPTRKLAPVVLGQVENEPPFPTEGG